MAPDVDTEPKTQVMEPEPADSRLLPSSLGGQSYGNAMQIPVVISISANNNRNDMIPSQLPGIVSQPIRSSFYTPQVVNTYPYQNGNAIAFNPDISSSTGSISLAPSAPIQPITQVATLRWLTRRVTPFLFRILERKTSTFTLWTKTT